MSQGSAWVYVPAICFKLTFLVLSSVTYFESTAASGGTPAIAIFYGKFKSTDQNRRLLKFNSMGKFSNSITAAHKDFIKDQHIFFVATAPLSGEGRVNLSPKGLDCFRVLADNRVAYMDLISSGNETSAHTLENGRITFMFCSFSNKPSILRLYGKGFTVLRGSNSWELYSKDFIIYPSTRQIIVADIDLVQTSCGFGVPLFDYAGERNIHFEWAEKKGAEGLVQYMKEKNLKSLDSLPTNLGLEFS